MGVAMVVAEPNTAEPVVGPEAAERLAQLGVTRIAVLADTSGIGVSGSMRGARSTVTVTRARPGGIGGSSPLASFFVGGCATTPDFGATVYSLSAGLVSSGSES